MNEKEYLHYLLICWRCATKENPHPVIPFESPAARGQWATEHTRGTGHEEWWVKDVLAGEQPKVTGPKTPGQIRYERFVIEQYRSLGRIWDPWEHLPPEIIADWEMNAVLYGHSSPESSAGPPEAVG